MSAKNSMFSRDQVRHPPAWASRLWSRAKACALVFALAVLTLSTTGCATAIRGRSEDLVIESEPAGAHVRLSNGFTGRTPVNFRVMRKEPLTVYIRKEGYEPVTVILKPNLSGKGTVQATAGNATMVAGTIVVAAPTAVTSAGAVAAVAPVIAIPLGLVIVGSAAFDLHSGALYQHAKGPVKFILKPRAVAQESFPDPAPPRKTGPPDRQ